MDLKDLVAAMYVGTYLDTEQGRVLNGCVEISKSLNATTFSGEEDDDWSKKDCCCSKGKCSTWAMSVLEVMGVYGILELPTSTSKSPDPFKG